MTVVARTSARLLLLAFVILGLLAAQSWSAGSARAAAAPAYDSLPTTLPANWPSLGYQATQTVEFGDLVQLAGSDRELTTIKVGFADWACETGGGATCVTTPGATWTHPITVNLYAQGTDPTPGALLATVTENVTVPYRPSADPGRCGGATSWFDETSSSCYNGLAFTWEFDFTTLAVLLPETVIVGVAFDTQTYGTPPIGADGPYNSLNVGLIESAPAVGTDVDPSSMYWNTGFASFYNDGGTAGTGTFRNDTGGWAGFGLAVQINAQTSLTTLPFPADDPAALPTLAATGSAPGPLPLIAVAGFLTLGAALVMVGGRRRAAHRG
ncbi:MAG: hypothetical protein ABIR17_12295 [Pseudolysinimonas sp.]|uniref:hypothetical protein n=1 Tax=Pseudolysinimonas sp. TaxID=2680009 RepID=UPI0032630CFC